MGSLFCFEGPLSQKSATTLIKKYYLAAVSNKLWLRSILEDKVLEPLSVETQENILNVTLRNTISRSYPPPISFQKFFLRLIIDVVEYYGSELSDNLLHEYTQVLMKPSKDVISYHNYVLNEEVTIIVQENPCFVASGTTGLRTWDASKFLSEWCVENDTIFNNRTILELGCGVGFLGLVVLKISHPKRFIFTDKSWEVLNILSNNIEINFNSEDELMSSYSQPKDCVSVQSFNGHYNAHDVPIIEKQQLVWDKMTQENATSLSPEIILGGDIIYDPSVTPSLAHALKILLCDGACAYIACVVRNSDTTNKFIKDLESAELKYELLSPPKKSIFMYDRTLDYVLYKIYKYLS